MTASCGRARRLVSLTLPYVVKPRTVWPPAGCVSRPTLTSDACTVPSARTVATTASPFSATARATASLSVVMSSPHIVNGVVNT
ncbi:hypothetical protein BZL30_4904 [Mycobacterium kansasii]|uniref:Uncharacterized protein n=1 Tax=Mycobacterium kansasii TaxID=1768 RepID=A0A1V3X490_MYCKA|nr:hypothetical protein BZL30_4904 [Mycobacterium kansasii]